MVTTPPKWITDQRGRRKSNPEYQKYLRQQQYEKNKREFEKMGIQFPKNYLGRSASDRVYGNTRTPIDQYSSSEQKSIMLEKLINSARSGRITPEEYRMSLKSINENYKKVRSEERKRRRWSSTISARSAVAKEREIREIGRTKGIAVGSVTREGVFSSSRNSLVQNDSRVNEFIQATRTKQQAVQKIRKVPIQPSVLSQSEKLTRLGLSTIYNVDQNAKLAKESFNPKRPTAKTLSENIIGFTGFNQVITGKDPFKEDKITDGFVGPVKLPEKKPLDKAVDWFEDITRKSENPVVDFFGGLGKELTSNVAGLVNLEQKGGELFYQAITGQRYGNLKEVKVSETAPGHIFEGLTSGAYESITKGDVDVFTQSLSKSFQKAEALVRKQGSAETFGQIAALALPTKGATKAIPFKIKSLKVPTVSGKTTTVAKTLEIGYASKTKPIISKIDSKFFKGEPTKRIQHSSLPKIEALDRGFEMSTAGSLGTRIFTSDKGLGSLVKAGKMLPRDAEAIRLSKELSDIVRISSKKVPDKIRKKAETLPDKPLTTLEEGAESKALVEKIIPKTPTKKGTLAETLQLDENLIIQKGKSRNVLDDFGKQKNIRSDTTGDLDIDYGHLPFGTWRANRAADRAVKIFSEVAEKNRKFFKKGTNVFSQTKGQEPEEVLNILTKRDAKTGYLNPISKPFEVSLKKKAISVKTGRFSKTKFLSIEQQAMNRIESFTSLQGPKSLSSWKGDPNKIPGLKSPLKTTEEGYTMFAAIHRAKDPMKLLVQDTVQIGRNLIETGKLRQSAELTKSGKRAIEISERIKKLYPEIDYDVLAKSEPMIYKGSSLSSKLSSGLDKVTSTLPIVIRESSLYKPEKTPESYRFNELTYSKPASKSAYRGSAVRKSYGIPLSDYRSSRGVVIQKSKTAPKPSKTNSVVDQVWGKSPGGFGKSSGNKGTSPSVGPSVSPGKSGSPGITGTAKTNSPLGPIITTDTPSIRQNRPLIIPTYLPIWETRKDKPKHRPRKYRKDFLGNVPIDKIEGIFGKRRSITYDEKEIGRAIKKDVSDTKKKYRKTFLSLKKSEKSSKTSLW